MAQNSSIVTIDTGDVANVTIEGEWQTLHLRASVEQDPDDSWLTVSTDKGESISIPCDIMGKALPFLQRFGQTGMLHEPPANTPEQDPLIAAAFLVATTMHKEWVIESDVAGHRGTYALSKGQVVRLYGDTEMPFDGTMEDILTIVNDGAYYIRRR